MKKQSHHTAPMKKLSDADRLSISIGSLDIARRSEAELVVHFPASVEMLQRVVVNGEVFYRSNSLVQIVRVAPIKYLRSHFVEVNKIVIERYFTQEAALKEVAGKYGIVYENFRRQYYERGGNKIRPKGGE